MVYSAVTSSDASLSLRIIAVDFSIYECIMGIGVAVYEGDLRHVLRQSFTLSWASHALAKKCKSRGCINKAVKVALYGFHRREFRPKATYKFLKLLNGKGLRVSQLIATDDESKVISSIEQWTSYGVTFLIYDTPGTHRCREGIYFEELIIQKITSILKNKGLIDIIIGKNYFIVLSDVVAYLAALNKYLSYERSLGKEDEKVEEKINKLIKLLKPLNLRLL